MDFSSQLKQWAKAKNVSIHKAIAMTAIRLGTNIIERSPVDDGRLKGNWMTAFGSADTAIDDSATANDSTPRLHAKLTVSEVGRNSSIYITNSLPYANTVEYGLYPSPVKRGTWNKRTKQWEIRSEGGFSKLAPQGMVRISIAEFKEILYREANNAK